MIGYKRPHHCLFAFQVLPRYFFSDPSFAEALSKDTGGALAQLWSDVGKAVAEKGGEHIATPPTVHKVIDDSLRCFVVITMPEPLYSPEAHLIGMLCDRPKNMLFWKTKPCGRYFTLEKEASLSERQEDAKTLMTNVFDPNSDDGPEARGEKFLMGMQAGLFEIRDADGNLMQNAEPPPNPNETFLCEIRADGSRENHGEGPKAMPDEFWKAVVAHL
jgi:hypothetical protein